MKHVMLFKMTILITLLFGIPSQGQERLRMTIEGGHASIVSSVAFIPDGKTLASVSFDHTIKLREVSTGRINRTIKGHISGISSVPDGRLMIGLFSGISSVTFSPDSKILATGNNESN